MTQALHAVRDLPVVVGVEQTTDRPEYGHPMLEVTVHHSCDRVPPAVARRLGAFDYGIVAVLTRGDPERYVVEAV